MSKDRWIIAWHGTRDDLSVLDVDRAVTRGGRAQHGPGLYLTTSMADAFSYSLPVGFLWECEVDRDAPGTKAVETMEWHPDGPRPLIHFVVSHGTSLRVLRIVRLEQIPARKLSHRERVLASIDPAVHGIRLGVARTFMDL